MKKREKAALARALRGALATLAAQMALMIQQGIPPSAANLWAFLAVPALVAFLLALEKWLSWTPERPR